MPFDAAEFVPCPSCIDPPSDAQRFKEALDKLKPDLAKLSKDNERKKQSSVHRSRFMADLAATRDAQAVETRAPSVRPAPGPVEMLAATGLSWPRGGRRWSALTWCDVA